MVTVTGEQRLWGVNDALGRARTEDRTEGSESLVSFVCLSVLSCLFRDGRISP